MGLFLFGSMAANWAQSISLARPSIIVMDGFFYFNAVS